MTEVIRAEGLVKHYGDVKALDGLDLAVPQGKVLGLLGPNGAGKTTAVRILTTLLIPDSGRVEVAGVDVLANPDAVRSRIGLSGQNAAVDEHLTGFENLDMVGRLYRLGREKSRRRARELLLRFELDEAGDRPAKTYSGGMRRRLDLAAALVAKPAVLFLDEPTTGLDPGSRNNMWQVIRELVTEGATVLLTTQYLEEADRLADNIIVIDHGRSIAEGTADELKDQIGGGRVEVVIEDPERVEEAAEVLTAVSGSEVTTDQHTRKVSAPAPSSNGTDALSHLLRAFEERSIQILDVGLRRPTLDDVFLTLTGHATGESDESQIEEKVAV